MRSTSERTRTSESVQSRCNFHLASSRWSTLQLLFSRLHRFSLSFSLSLSLFDPLLSLVLFTVPSLSLRSSFIFTSPFFSFFTRRPRFARVYRIDCIFPGKYYQVRVKPKISQRMGSDVLLAASADGYFINSGGFLPLRALRVLDCLKSTGICEEFRGIVTCVLKVFQLFVIDLTIF